MSEDLIRQLADFRSNVRRNAERTYQSQDNKQIHTFISIQQASPARVVRSSSSFINGNNNRPKGQNTIGKDIPKPNNELSSIADRLRERISTKKTNPTETSFIANYLQKQEENDQNKKNQKPPTSSFKIFSYKGIENRESTTSQWSLNQQQNQIQNRDNSQSRWNLNHVQQQQQQRSNQKNSSLWNLNLEENRTKESNLWSKDQFANIIQQSSNKNVPNYIQQSSNKNGESVKKNINLNMFSNSNKENNLNSANNGVNRSNSKKMSFDTKMTDLLPKCRIQQVQDYLIDTNEEDFNKLNADYIEELIKLSSVIMYKVKNSKYYKE